MFSNDYFQNLLDQKAPTSNDEIRGNIPEDLGIIHSNGYRSCINWELRGKGFFLENFKEYEEPSDEELLNSAYEELSKRRNKT